MNIPNLTPEQVAEIKAEAKRNSLTIPSTPTGIPDLSPEQIAEVKREAATQQSALNSFPAKAFTSFGLGVGQGFHDLGKGAANLAIKGVNKLGANIQPFERSRIAEQAPYPGFALAGEIASGLGVPLPGVGTLGKLSAGAGAFTKLGARAADAAATGAYMNPLYAAADPNANLGKNALTGALLGGTLGGALGLPAALIEHKVNRLAEGAYKGGALTPQQAGEAYQSIKPIIGASKIDLGSLINDPALSKKYHQDLKGTLGAGGQVENVQRDLIGKANQEAYDIIERLRGKHLPNNIPDELVNKVSSIKRDYSKKAGDMFKGLMKDAQEAGIQLNNFPSAEKYARQVLKEEKNVLASGVKGEIRKVLDKLVIDKNTPNPIQNKSTLNEKRNFKSAHFSHSNLGKLGDELAAKQEYRAASIANELQAKIRNDIENAIKNSKNKDLYKKWSDAREFFKENVVPFREKSITKILEGQSEPRKLAKELLLNKNKSIIPKLDQDTKNLVNYEQFSDLLKGIGSGNKDIAVHDLLRRYNSLENKNATKLLTPDIQQRFKNLSTLNSGLKEARLNQNVPPTGMRNVLKTAGIKDLLTYGGIGAAVNPWLGAGSGALKLGKNAAEQKLLTSDMLRNAYINQSAGNPERQRALAEAMIRAFSAGNP